MTAPEIHPVQRINQLYWGFLISRAIHVAAKVGLADYVDKAGTTVIELAQKTALDEDRLYRLMRLLASYEIFEETEKGTFIPTELSDAISSGEGSVRDAGHMITQSMWNAYGHLEHCIRTGGDAYTDLYGQGVFDYLDEHPEEDEQFAKAMHNYAEIENPIIAQHFPLAQIKTVVDVGGGHGGFLKELLMLHASLKGILFDQPQIVADAVDLSGTPDLAARFHSAGGDFFAQVTSGADAYILKRILHDWSDDDCCRILETIKAQMTSSSRVYVIDAIVPEGNVPHFSKDLEAFLMTWGGQERDQQEFETLFNRAGLELVSITETPAVLSIIEAKIAE